MSPDPSVQQVDRLLAAECVRVVPAVPQELARNASGLKRHLQGVSDLACRVSAIARSVQGKVAVLLGALQVGDSTRQRLEHVVSALHIVETHACDHGASSHIHRLLAAQLEAIVLDFSRETTALIGSLDGLVLDAQGLLDLILEQADDGGRAFLVRLEESVSGIDRVVGQLDTAQEQARSMTTLIATTVADLTTRVQSLGGVRLDVQDIATNTRLLCRRHGTIGRAVSVVASEVDANARQLGKITQVVAAAIDRLGQTQVSTSSGDDAGPPIGEALGSALAIIRQACQRTERVVLEGGDDARRLVDLVRQTATELSQELSLTGIMEGAAVALLDRPHASSADTCVDEEILQTLLPEIARLYTMAQEREIHARFLLPGMEIGSSVEIAGDDDDDGLF